MTVTERKVTIEITLEEARTLQIACNLMYQYGNVPDYNEPKDTDKVKARELRNALCDITGARYMGVDA